MLTPQRFTPQRFTLQRYNGLSARFENQIGVRVKTIDRVKTTQPMTLKYQRSSHIMQNTTSEKNGSFETALFVIHKIDDENTMKKNFEFVKETYFDLIGKTLEVCDTEKVEDRQLLAMFISTYFLKVVDFKHEMNIEKKTYFQAIAMHFILETGECEIVDEFYGILNRFIKMVNEMKYD